MTNNERIVVLENIRECLVIDCKGNCDGCNFKTGPDEGSQVIMTAINLIKGWDSLAEYIGKLEAGCKDSVYDRGQLMGLTLVKDFMERIEYISGVRE